MLLIAVAAVWTAYYTGRKSIERDLVAIEAMHALAPELLVRNRNEYTCLQIDRADDIREFQCYLPAGRDYKLQLLWSKEFALDGKTLQPEISATMTAGYHQILLNQLPDKLVVTVDGEEVIDVPRKHPESISSASTGVSDRFESQWYPMNQPLTLVRLRETTNGQFLNGQFLNGAGHGIALWIEMVE
jgi:hypothetical protein